MQSDCAVPTHTAYSVTSLDFAETGQFQPAFLDYLNGNPKLASVLGPPPTLAELDRLAAQKRYPKEQRKTLVQALERQYTAGGITTEFHKNITKLAEDDTFTVTTGHQLVIFLGPLYTVLKALTTVRLAQEMEKAYPNRKVVPIFWLAGEDHDLEEISDVTIQGQRYHWQPPQGGQAGTQPLDGLHEALAAIWPRLPSNLEQYTRFTNLIDAQRWLLHTLFGDMGLVVVDPADPALKEFFKPYILRELTEHFVEPAVQAATNRMEAAGYPAQIVPRDTNLFMLGPEARERLVLHADGHYSAGRLGHFSKEEILALAEAEPERFSPNVSMRPLYQEVLLPNLAYIGGPAEVVYWMQLKNVFESAGVQMPVVWPRVHATIATAKDARKLDELGLTVKDLWQDLHDLKKKVVAEKGSDKPDTEALLDLFQQYADRLEALTLQQDPALAEAMAAERVRLQKQLKPGLKRLDRAYERRFEHLTSQAEKLQARLAPGGGLQERKESYLTFDLIDPAFIQNLAEVIDPTCHRFLIVTQNLPA